MKRLRDRGRGIEGEGERETIIRLTLYIYFLRSIYLLQIFANEILLGVVLGLG